MSEVLHVQHSVHAPSAETQRRKRCQVLIRWTAAKNRGSEQAFARDELLPVCTEQSQPAHAEADPARWHLAGSVLQIPILPRTPDSYFALRVKLHMNSPDLPKQALSGLLDGVDLGRKLNQLLFNMSLDAIN